MLLRQSVENKYLPITLTYLYMFNFTILVVFCVYIEYISKNAIIFLHTTNAVSLMCAAIYYSIMVIAPLRFVATKNQEGARKSLNYIAWFNSKFTRTIPFDFDTNIEICA